MAWLTGSPWPLVLAGCLYVLMGVGFYRQSCLGLAVTHWCYAAANVGLVMAWYEAAR